MKRKQLFIALWILTDALACFALFRLLRIDRAEWIIQIGIVQADQRINLYRIVWCVAAAGINLAFALRLILAKRRPKRVPPPLFSMEQVQEPEAIRRELTALQASHPNLCALLQQGLDQLDNIARQKERLQTILTRNELSLLAQAYDALCEAEQTLCVKLVLVMNRALLCDPKEKNARRKEAVYGEHMRYMSLFLTENEELLNRCEQLLAQTARYVEERKAGRDSGNVQIMTDVIRSLTGDGIKLNANGGECK